MQIKIMSMIAQINKLKFLNNIILRTILFICFYLIGCQNRTYIKENEIKNYRTLNIADSIILSENVTELVSNDKSIIIFDEKVRHYIVYDLINNSFQVFNYGDSPEEIGSLYSANCINEKIYASDIGKNAISVYDLKGKFLFNLKSPVKDALRYPFGIDDNENIYISSFIGEKPIIKFNKDGKIAEFGEYLPSNDEREKRANNYRGLIYSRNKKLISFFIASPIIEEFSILGEKLKSYDLSHYFSFHVARVTKKYKESKLNRFTTWNLFRDAYYSNGFLYLLFWGDYEIPNSNQIMVLEDRPEGLLIQKVMKLNIKGASFSSICIILP